MSKPSARTPNTGNSNLETRRRLLDAAGEVFAEKGYRAATIREICRRAKANVAAVNYHFGDKERLYAELLRYAARHRDDEYPGRAGAPGALAPALRLRQFVEWFVGRTLGQGRPAWRANLLARELIDPSPALDTFVQAEIRPLFAALEEICRELLGPGASDEGARFAARSVAGQCLHYRTSLPVIARLHPEDQYRPDFVHRLTEHITEFSLGGLERLARGTHTDGLTGPPSEIRHE